MKYALLAILAAGPAHGYELKQSFEARFGAVWPPVNIGQVYMTLQRLERDGLVRGRQGDRGSRPARHVFEITEAGLRILADWLREASPGPRLRDEFVMKLLLAGQSGIAAPMDLLERQRLAYLQELRDLNQLAALEGDGGDAAHLLIEAAVLHLEAGLKWLDLCEDQLRQKGSL